MVSIEESTGVSFGLTEEQKALRELAREFAANEIRPHEHECDEHMRHPADLIAKAHNMRQMRPFSRRCAAVSAPLPTWSSYSTVCSSTTRSEPIGPLGERLT